MTPVVDLLDVAPRQIAGMLMARGDGPLGPAIRAAFDIYVFLAGGQ